MSNVVKFSTGDPSGEVTGFYDTRFERVAEEFVR